MLLRGLLAALFAASASGSQLLTASNITGHWSGTLGSGSADAWPVEFDLLQGGGQVTGTAILGPGHQVHFVLYKLDDLTWAR